MSRVIPSDHPLKSYVIRAEFAGATVETDYRYKPSLGAIKRKMDAVIYRRELAALNKVNGWDWPEGGAV